MKSLLIYNTSSITKFSPCFSNYNLWSQKLKVCSKLSELDFFPHKCLLPDVILNEGVSKLTRRKHFLQQKFLWTVWEMSVYRKCKHYSRGFICSIFVLWRVKVEVKVIGQSIWKCTWRRDSNLFLHIGFNIVYEFLCMCNAIWVHVTCTVVTAHKLWRLVLHDYDFLNCSDKCLKNLLTEYLISKYDK